MSQGAAVLLIEQLESIDVDIEAIERLIASETPSTSNQLLALRTIQDLYRRLADDLRVAISLFEDSKVSIVSETKQSYPPPPGYSADWIQVDQTHAVLISQRYVQTIVGFAVGSTLTTTRIPTGSQDGFVVATLMQATRVENVKAVFASPYQSGTEYGVNLTVTLVAPAVAGEQALVCLYQPSMNFS